MDATNREKRLRPAQLAFLLAWLESHLSVAELSPTKTQQTVQVIEAKFILIVVPNNFCGSKFYFPRSFDEGMTDIACSVCRFAGNLPTVVENLDSALAA